MKLTLQPFRVLSALLFASTLLVSGCAQLQDLQQKLDDMAAERHRNTYASQSDKGLATSFYALADNGRKEVLEPSLAKSEYVLQAANVESLHFKRRWISHEQNWRTAQDKMDTYSRSVLDDPVTQKYLEVARSRGNVVRLYRPALGSKVNALFKQYHLLQPDKNTKEWYGIDNALVEYGPAGQVLSVLTKSYQGVATLGVFIDEYVHVYYGPRVSRHVENSISNTAFNERYLRDLAGGSAPAATGPESTAPVASQFQPQGQELTASSTCGRGEQLVRYTSARIVKGGTRIDAVVVKTGRKTSAVVAPIATRSQMPRMGQFQCWRL
jgi:hypothetical protein